MMTEEERQRMLDLFQQVENARYWGHKTVSFTLTDMDFIINWVDLGTPAVGDGCCG